MATNQTNNDITKKSALDNFRLHFEYDRNWKQAKETVQLRPSKK